MPVDYKIGIIEAEHPGPGEDEHNVIYVPSFGIPDTNYVFPTWLYEACVRHFVKRKIIGSVTPCPGCESSYCPDCRPEIVDDWTEPAGGPEHPEWLQPIDMDKVAEAIDDLEARLYG